MFYLHYQIRKQKLHVLTSLGSTLNVDLIIELA